MDLCGPLFTLFATGWCLPGHLAKYVLELGQVLHEILGDHVSCEAPRLE